MGYQLSCVRLVARGEIVFKTQLLPLLHEFSAEDLDIRRSLESQLDAAAVDAGDL